MACIAPPELEDKELLAFLDGEGDKGVVEHLDQCLYCREKAVVLARLQGRLTGHLYRIACPSPDELGEFYLGLLPQTQAPVVSEHLAECPHCQRETAQLESYLQTLEAASKPSSLAQARERIRVLVARLVNEISDIDFMSQSNPALAYAGLRGGEKAPLVYQADALQVVIDAQIDPDKPDQHMVLGLVLGLEALEESSAHLWQKNQPLADVPIDELGNFIFSGLVEGAYELIISNPHLEIHIQDLTI